MTRDGESGAGVAPVGPIDADCSCSGCGYNLRGLPPTGLCPECGAPVARTLSEVAAAPAQAVWLRHLRDGMVLIVLSAGVSVAGFSTAAPSWAQDLAGSDPGWRSDLVMYALFGLYLSPLVLLGYGVWAATRKPPAGSGFAARPAWRWALRLMAAVGNLSPFVWVLWMNLHPGAEPSELLLWSGAPRWAMLGLSGAFYVHLFFVGRALKKKTLAKLALVTALFLPVADLWLLHIDADGRFYTVYPLSVVGYPRLLELLWQLLSGPRLPRADMEGWESVLPAIAATLWAILFLSGCGWTFARQARRLRATKR